MDTKEILKELRKKHKLTGKQVAEQCEMSYNVYQMYESGQRNLGVPALCKIADYYGVSVDYLLGRTEIKEPAFIDILTALGIDDSYRLSPEEFGEAFDALEQPVKVIIYKVMTEMVNKLQSISQDQATATVEDIPEPLKPFA